MPEIIWKTESDQFRLFKFCEKGTECTDCTIYNGDYFTFYVSVMIQMMNHEASFVFADFCFCDNYWELLDEWKIDSIYRKVIIENINKLTFAECYNLLYELKCYCIWTDETDEVFTIDTLNRINDINAIKTKLYYAISDHIVYCDHIEIIPEDYCLSRYSGLSIPLSRICYRVRLKDSVNTNIIARYIYKKIERAKNTNKEFLEKSINEYILRHIQSPVYRKKDLENVIYEYGIQNAFENYRHCFDCNRYHKDNDITFDIAYSILCDSFEYIAYSRSSL
jgi:hypothetical protein